MVIIINRDNRGGIVKIVIFGANGQTGRVLTRRVLDAGHAAVAVTRHPDEFPIAATKLTVAGADVHDEAALVDVVDGADAVLSTLGVTFSRQPIDTYSVGMRNIAAAMDKTGVQRLVVVSSTNMSRRRNIPFALRLVEPIITHVIGKTLYDDIRRMEAIVRNSGLDWTIVRASLLFDLPHPTNYIAGETVPASAFTARIDLADYLLALAGQSAGGNTVVVSTVEHTPTLWQTIRREAFKSAR
jgi:putative NADH-flavin reductase